MIKNTNSKNQSIIHNVFLFWHTNLTFLYFNMHIQQNFGDENADINHIIEHA